MIKVYKKNFQAICIVYQIYEDKIIAKHDCANDAHKVVYSMFRGNEKSQIVPIKRTQCL
jgi:hypothetical protein